MLNISTEGVNPRLTWVAFKVSDTTNVLPLIIEFMYSGNIELSIGNCAAILHLSRLLQISSIQKLATVFFRYVLLTPKLSSETHRTNLQRETALQFLSSVVLFDHILEDMKLMCITTISRNFCHLFNDKSPPQVYKEVKPPEFLTIISNGKSS